MRGDGWYDGLPRIDDVVVLIHADDAVHRYEEGDDSPADLVSGRVDDLRLALTVYGIGDADRQELRLSIDAPVCDGEGCGHVDGAFVLLRRDADVAPDRLADQIMDALFHADEDADSDSAETQRDRFRREARATAIGLLQDKDAADLDRIRSAFQDDVRWLIPAGRTVAITARPDGLPVGWVPTPGIA